MPITSFQGKIFNLLKENRNPESYVAGGTMIQRDAESTRFSHDIDIFHESDMAVARAFSLDTEVLKKNNYEITLQISQPGFIRSLVTKGKESLLLEWVRDSAFRFFPVIEDAEFGYRLHDIDLATNKCLALANRSEARDVLDMLDIDKKTLSLAGCCWAACGKDPGFTPNLMLDMIQRHSALSPDKFSREALRVPIDPVTLKKTFLRTLDDARKVVQQLPANDLGCIYLDSKGSVVKNLKGVDLSKCERHFGGLKGSWPRVSS